MSCYRPLSAYRTPEGEVKLGVCREDSRPLQLPCGRCIGCIWRRRRGWQLRLMHEAQLYDRNVCATLTYSPENLPASLSLEYRDFQCFMKRLRKEVAGADGRNGVRFFVAGEYGEGGRRPHFHVVLFNCWFSDLERKGRYMYSRQAERLWGNGQVVLDLVTPASAGYVAGYAAKKKFGRGARDHYEDVVNPATGELSSRRPEFVRMSLRRGIGAAWYDRFASDLWSGDFAVQAGQKYSVPRYYFKRLQKENPLKAEEVVNGRIDRALLMPRSEETPERRAVREECHAARVASREVRGL